MINVMVFWGFSFFKMYFSDRGPDVDRLVTLMAVTASAKEVTWQSTLICLTWSKSLWKPECVLLACSGKAGHGPRTGWLNSGHVRPRGFDWNLVLQLSVYTHTVHIILQVQRWWIYCHKMHIKAALLLYAVTHFYTRGIQKKMFSWSYSACRLWKDAYLL